MVEHLLYTQATVVQAYIRLKEIEMYKSNLENASKKILEVF